ncbi:PP2C family protein-serine/threonine phosphatase [Streptomyces sp. GESEQ-4]|uniref:PP2C family protein-serine/threonine phosphatase n=1 Tax=Streptomyces sp. GESEQ-4 TaxID=2812655 RepID=UPI001B32AADA|nr:PP2C family protein-serine/threonine phosphatase [Streptomyces sp. GESEQ-4]
MSGRGLRPVGGRRPLVRLPDAVPRDVLQHHQILRIRDRSVAWVPPLLVLVGILIVDWNTTRDFRIITWIVLVPSIAAAICGVWGTAAYAVLATVAYPIADGAWPNEYQAGPADFFLVAVGSVLAVLACAVRVRGERRMLHMRDVTETIRRTVLRPLPPGWGGLEHAAVYLTADVEARVGGDFYDIQPGPHGTRVLIGDVQGKGLGAVEAAAALLGTFREAGYHEPELATVADRLEVRMLRHGGHVTALGRDDADRFATAVLVGFPESSAGRFFGRGSVVAGRAHAAEPHMSQPRAPLGRVPEPGVVEVVVFAHEPPLLVGTDGVRSLPSGGDTLPLGLSTLAPAQDPPPVQQVTLAPGETLLMTTDGVTEARDTDGVFYPLATEVARAVAADPRTVEPRRLVDFVREGVLRHCGGRLADDTTVFAVRRLRPLEARDG